MHAKKSKALAILLAVFLGGIGMHRFYLGKFWSGLLFLLFCWTFVPAIIALFDAAIILFTSRATWEEMYG